MIELRISAIKDELEQMLDILKACRGLELISISKQYPNRGCDSRIRIYLQCDIKKPAFEDSSIFDIKPFVNNSFDEVLEYMDSVDKTDPKILDEDFFSTFCCNCQYLTKSEGADFFCKCRWKEIKNILEFDKFFCPIFKKMQEEKKKNVCD